MPCHNLSIELVQIAWCVVRPIVETERRGEQERIEMGHKGKSLQEEPKR